MGSVGERLFVSRQLDNMLSSEYVGQVTVKTGKCRSIIGIISHKRRLEKIQD